MQDFSRVDTIMRGNATEAAVLQAFVTGGWQVWMPFGDGARCDLLVDWRDEVIRVQCKTGRVRQGCIVFNSYATDHGSGVGSYVGSADVFGVACPELDQIYVIPIADVSRTEGRLRLEPARNNQRKRIRAAEPYRFSTWDPEGLIERVRGGRGLASSPATATG